MQKIVRCQTQAMRYTSRELPNEIVKQNQRLSRFKMRNSIHFQLYQTNDLANFPKKQYFVNFFAAFNVKWLIDLMMTNFITLCGWYHNFINQGNCVTIKYCYNSFAKIFKYFRLVCQRRQVLWHATSHSFSEKLARKQTSWKSQITS